MKNNMNKKVKITLSEHQQNILMEEVEPYILNTDTERVISTAISKNSKCHISLAPDDLEELIGSICFVHNHEEKNKNLVLELDELIDYLECMLDECK